MKIIRLFRNVFCLHGLPDVEKKAAFDKCKGCEYGVLVKPWVIHCIAGANSISKARKDKSRKCQYKPSRWGQ